MVDLVDLAIVGNYWNASIGDFAEAAGMMNVGNMSWEAAMTSVVFGADNMMFAPSVPEPASLVLLTLGGLAMLRRRRK